jgi:hypothetical protein
MSTLIIVFILSLSALALAITIIVCVRGIRAYVKARGKRLVTCPETQCAAAVELDARGSGWKALRGESYMHLRDCSRWPEKQDCAQDCLQQIETLGQGCLVGNIVASWYQGKTCFYCHKPLDKVEEWTGHIPALLGPDNKTAKWGDIPPEKLPEVFEKYQPVCWSCHIAETFRREHADLVTDRPARW